jgi:hypothetical protein
MNGVPAVGYYAEILNMILSFTEVATSEMLAVLLRQFPAGAAFLSKFDSCPLAVLVMKVVG